MSGTNYCMAKAASAALSKVEVFPKRVSEINMSVAIDLFDMREEEHFVAMNKDIWFTTGGVPVCVSPGKRTRAHIMSFDAYKYNRKVEVERHDWTVVLGNVENQEDTLTHFVHATCEKAAIREAYRLETPHFYADILMVVLSSEYDKMVGEG